MEVLVPQLSPATKDRISMTRMLCVLGMIFVHVPDGINASPVYSMDTASMGFLLERFIVEGSGRASAALLSVVSGYLAAISLIRSRGSFKVLYQRRFISIFVPMVFWGAVTYLVYWLVSYSRPTFVSDAMTLLDKLNVVFFLTEIPSGPTTHLSFLRDLFVCVLLSPVLLLAIKRFRWLLLLGLGFVYVLGYDQNGVIILRTLVIFAFSIGMFLALRNVELSALDRYLPVFLILSVCSAGAVVLVKGGAAAGLVDVFAQRGLEFNEVVLYPLSRLFSSLTIWTLTSVLLGGWCSVQVTRFSPYLFVAFCSHFLMLTIVFFSLWQPLFGGAESSLFIVWFLAGPFVAMGIAIMIVKIALKISPRFAMLITGGRIEAPRAIV